MKRALVIHPFLIALWTVLFDYSENVGLVPFSQAWVSLFLLLGLALVLLLLFTAILRNVMPAGAVLSLLLLLFFSYAHAYTLIWGERTTYAPTAESLALLLAWAVLFAAGVALIFRISGRWPEVTRILNLLALTLLAIPAFNIAAHEVEARTSKHELLVRSIDAAGSEPVALDTLPDIYYIILDAYGRADVLEEVYGYDNSAFLDYLRQRGFFVAQSSRSNYAQTDLSLASSLNATYLDDLAASVGLETSDRRPMAYMIQNNALVQFLRQHGYTIVALASGYAATDLQLSDVHVDLGRTWNELEVRLLCSTPIPWLALRGSVFDPYAVHRQKMLHTLSHIADATGLPSPRFVFAHLLAPHGPFVFDAQGNEVQPGTQFDLRDSTPYDTGDSTWEDHVRGYTGQVTFINNRMQSAIDDLLSQASRPTIVVLQADHGPASRVDWEHPTETAYRDRFAILNAILLPADGSEQLYAEITPVNTFRLILNNTFGTDLPLLDDESYFSTWQRPYRFENVTDEARFGAATRPSQ